MYHFYNIGNSSIISIGGACFLPLLLVNTSRSATSSSIGNFIQFTDFHQDDWYNSTSGDTAYYCHHNPNASIANNTKLGQYGDFRCDSPQALVLSAIKAAKIFLPDPDFIIWTGDSFPHIPNNLYSTSNVISTLKLVTSQLKSAGFPASIPILPVFGNHDYWHSDAFPDKQNAVFQSTFEMWKDWIGEENRATFLRGGYYQYRRWNNLTVLALNTNLYYRFDSAFCGFQSMRDPAGQFAFMEQVLSSAQANGDHVGVFAHIAPGAFERTPNFTWFREDYNRRFLNITVRYSSIIKWMLFGHHHTDTFHIVKDNAGKSAQVYLLAPAVTPWRSTLPGAGANNPAFRTFSYDPNSWDLQDISTYSVNLTALNQQPNDTHWQLEYRFSDPNGYNITPPITATAMNDLLQRMKLNQTLFDLYIRYNSVNHGYNATLSADPWRSVQLCAIEFPDYQQYFDCLAKNNVNSATVGATISPFADPNCPKTASRMNWSNLSFITTLLAFYTLRGNHSWNFETQKHV